MQDDDDHPTRIGDGEPPLLPGSLRTLLLAGDTAARAATAGWLRRSGIDVQARSGDAPPAEWLHRAAFDVLLLHAPVLGSAGARACLEVRAHSHVPIVALLDAEDWQSRVACLDAGADDCLGVPFDPRELVARLHALVRRSGGRQHWRALDEPAATLRFDGWALDAAMRRLVSPSGDAAMLSAIEFRLLSALLARPGQRLNRNRLLAALGGAAPGSPSAIDSAVARLRRKLGSDARLVQTVRGEGFVFTGTVG